MAFREIKPEQLPGNVVDEICNKWMLLAAGTPEDFNFMTVNWGMMGELWFQPAVTVYVRDSRHTLRYMENNDTFTLISLKEGHREQMVDAVTAVLPLVLALFQPEQDVPKHLMLYNRVQTLHSACSPHCFGFV